MNYKGIGIDTFMCKKVTLQLAVIFLLLLKPSLPAHGQYTLTTGVRYDTFKDDTAAENRGSEVTFPFSIAYKGDRFAMRVITAYASSEFDSGDSFVPDASISSLTDTLVSTSYTLPSLPVGLVFGVDVNLPTGKENLTAEERRAELGDNNNLVEIDNFGDGLNLNLNAGLAKQMGEIGLALGVSYIYRGEYDPTADVPNDDLDPGDEFSLASIISLDPTKEVSLTGFIGYVFFKTDQVNGQDSFREGNKLTLGADISFSRVPYRLTVSLQDSFQAKSERINPATSPVAERETTNGDQFFASINFGYEFSETLTLRAIADTRIFGENDEDSTSLFFDAGSTRYSLGPGFSYELVKNLYVNGIIKYFTLKEKQDAQLQEDVTFKGFNLDLGVIYLF